MNNDEFIGLMEEVKCLISESHEQKDLDLPLMEFHRLWETNKNNIPMPDGMEKNPTTFACFYNHYLMLRMLQRVSGRLENKKVSGEKKSNIISYLKLVE